ncbi:MAG: hypothetical protein IJK42_09635 [Prevotella sp.]|nr:hypothetical protein [Prevotella sp.]
MDEVYLIMKKKIIIWFFITLVVNAWSQRSLILPDQSGNFSFTSYGYQIVTPDRYGNMINKSAFFNVQTNININVDSKLISVKRQGMTFNFRIVNISGNLNPNFRCIDMRNNIGCYVNVGTVYDNIGDVWFSYDTNKDYHYYFKFK